MVKCLWFIYQTKTITYNYRLLVDVFAKCLKRMNLTNFFLAKLSHYSYTFSCWNCEFIVWENLHLGKITCYMLTPLPQYCPTSHQLILLFHAKIHTVYFAHFPFSYTTTRICVTSNGAAKVKGRSLLSYVPPNCLQ